MDWIAGWSKRIKFTIDHTKIDETLYDFPVLVNLDTTCSGVFTELGSSSKKLLFINPSSGEEYFCEIERWDYINTSAQLWVKISTIYSTVDTEFYMFYDSSVSDNVTYVGETTSSAAKNVWDDNFVAVYHMAQDPSGTAPQILDSTSNENNGTANGSMTSSDLVDGFIGKAIEFDGSDDYII